MECSKILNSHEALNNRKDVSEKRLKKVRDHFDQCELFKEKDLNVFCAGSLGRFEIGELSDLDLFVISEQKEYRLDKIVILAKLIEINKELGFKTFSNDGKFLILHSMDDMTEKLGDPADDSENLFTTRMLLLLESKCILNPALYDEHINKILSHYFRDRKGHPKFEPIFLLNDILRYWRTLCLNYERIRNDPNKDWRKKNVNLKFSRPLTVFSTVLPLLSVPIRNHEDMKNLIIKTPLQRLAYGLDSLKDASLTEKFKIFLDTCNRGQTTFSLISFPRVIGDRPRFL